jgi:small subunit ribosomal protein S17
MVKKILVGEVISDKMDKTRVVMVTRLYRHPLYEKTIEKRKKYYIHDERNESRVGDVVKFIESRPLSHLKRWRLLEIVSKSKKRELEERLRSGKGDSKEKSEREA